MRKQQKTLPYSVNKVLFVFV